MRIVDARHEVSCSAFSRCERVAAPWGIILLLILFNALFVGIRKRTFRILHHELSFSIHLAFDLLFLTTPTICSVAYSALIYECFDDDGEGRGLGNLADDWSMVVGSCEQTQSDSNVTWISANGTQIAIDQAGA